MKKAASCHGPSLIPTSETVENYEHLWDEYSEPTQAPKRLLGGLDYSIDTLTFLIHPIPQFLAGLEMRHELAVEVDRLTGLGVAAYAGLAVVQ